MTSSKNLFLSVLFSIVFLCYSCCAIFIQPDIKTATQKDAIRLPVVMYHLVLDDSKKLGKYVVSPTELESDIKYLSDNGYQTVVFKDLINYVEHDIPLPQKPVMITFDDGYYNNKVFAYNILKKYNYKAVISVIGKYSEQYSNIEDVNKYYSHLTWDDLKEISDVFEIQNHSYNLHTFNKRQGAKKMKNESSERYSKILYDDLLKNHNLIKEKTGIEPTIFTFPFGSMCTDAHVVVSDKMKYKGSMSCEEGINYITKEPQCLYQIKRYNRPHGVSTTSFFKKLLKNF